MRTLPQHAPVVIVGGGPVGAALALALGGGHADPLLLEARSAPEAVDDTRFLALCFGSRLILERLGVWSTIEPLATPIWHIEVSQQGGFGRTELAAEEIGLSALGYVVRYRDLARNLSLAAARQVRCAAGVAVTDVKAMRHLAAVDCTVEGASCLVSAALLVLADGGGSLAAKGGFAAPLVRDYRQWAVVAWVRAKDGTGRRAYERFTAFGPAALLPAGDGYSVVLTLPEEEAKALAAASDETFLARLRTIFGTRAGQFSECSPRATFPLVLRYAETVVGNRMALVGNAAQTLHPVAGQGFNLGLRDVWTLAQVALRTPADEIGSRAMLDRFRRERARDRASGILVTDSLVRLFSNDVRWLRSMRGLGLAMLDFSDGAKHFLMRRMTFGA